jgi:RNA polymerase sigma factor (sigma-70 family)
VQCRSRGCSTLGRARGGWWAPSFGSRRRLYRFAGAEPEEAAIGGVRVSVDLLARAQAGGGDAFGRLVDPYLRELQVYCYRFLGSVQDAEDALQDTLLAAWQGLAGFEGRASVRTWLYRVATSRCLDALRSARRRPPTSAPPPGLEPPEPTRLGELLWLEPYPDALLEGLADSAPGPEARYEATERPGWTARMIPTRTNGQPAFGFYARDPQTGDFYTVGLMVLTLSGTQICAMTALTAASCPDSDSRPPFQPERVPRKPGGCSAPCTNPPKGVTRRLSRLRLPPGRSSRARAWLGPRGRTGPSTGTGLLGRPWCRSRSSRCRRARGCAAGGDGRTRGTARSVAWVGGLVHASPQHTEHKFDIEAPRGTVRPLVKGRTQAIPSLMPSALARPGRPLHLRRWRHRSTRLARRRGSARRS